MRRIKYFNFALNKRIAERLSEENMPVAFRKEYLKAFEDNTFPTAIEIKEEVHSNGLERIKLKYYYRNGETSVTECDNYEELWASDDWKDGVIFRINLGRMENKISRYFLVVRYKGHFNGDKFSISLDVLADLAGLSFLPEKVLYEVELDEEKLKEYYKSGYPALEDENTKIRIYSNGEDFKEYFLSKDIVGWRFMVVDYTKKPLRHFGTKYIDGKGIV